MKKKRQLSWFTKVQAVIGFTALTVGLLLIPYNMLKNAFLSHSKTTIRAVIINEENAFGNNTRRFSYSYRFYQRGYEYTGNSLNSKYQVGDSVWVRYVPTFPRFNRIVESDE